MKNSAVLWTLAAVYFGGLGIIYFAVGGEEAGTTLLAFGAAFGGLVAGWLWRATHQLPSLGEDSGDASMAQDSGVIGEFPSESVRPLGIAVGMSGMLLGVAVGLWLSAVGIAILASQVGLAVWDTDR